ncbi:MAG: PilN domain-containing protein [Desulfuromonadales bacterium]
MKPQINLASRSYINRRGLNALYTLLTVLFLLLLILNGRSLFSLLTRQSQAETHLTEVRETLGYLKKDKNAKQTTSELVAIRQEIAWANAILRQDSFRWTALLGHLEEVITDSTRIRSIQPQFKDGSLKISGVAKNVTALQDFLDRVVASPHFTDVYLFAQSRVEIKDTGGRTHEALNFSLELKGAF